MHDSDFPFEILTPEHRFFQGKIEALTFTAEDGEWTILKGHAPMLAVLHPGLIKIKQNGTWRSAVNSEGYMEVGPTKTLLFVQTCEWPEEVDRKRAERSKLQAEEALRQSHSQAQFRANQAMLARAMARLRNSRSNVNLD